MNKKYLINDGFYLQYIREDLHSFLLYFDHFSQGVFLPKYMSNRYAKKIFHIVLRYLIIISYFTKFYKLKYKTKILNEDAIIVIQSKSEWGSTIKLIKKNGVLRIVKKLSNKEVYLREKEFYMKYKDNTTAIKLPEHIFMDNNTVEIDFIPVKNMQRLVIEGKYSFTEVLAQYKIIINELKKFYDKEVTLIHGDIALSNIFYTSGKYYLIDYSDSHVTDYHYDFYVTLFSILASFHFIKNKDKTISYIKINNQLPEVVVGVNRKQFEKIEEMFTNFRKKKFPEIYM